MKQILLTSVVIASLAGAAHAQLPDLTGQVTGTVNQTTRIGADALGNDAMIDQRSGLAVDTRLAGELQRALPRHNRGGSAALDTQLDAEASAFTRVGSTSAGTRIGTRQSARGSAGFAPVRVYAHDGAVLGRVERVRRSSGQRYVVIRTEGSGERVNIPVAEAAFDSRANAVILTQAAARLAGHTGASAGAGLGAMASGSAAAAGGVASGLGSQAVGATAGAAAGLTAAGSAASGLGSQAAGGMAGGSAALASTLRGTLNSHQADASFVNQLSGAASAAGSADGVPVFSADGALIGHAQGMTQGSFGDELVLRHASSGAVNSVAASQAQFNDQIGAVVLTQTQAEYDAAVSASGSR